jgi:tRNA(fMet)-specific endonuclease VapC
MTRYLLDSNVCIACLRRKPWALKALGNVTPVSVAVSAVTLGELMIGVHLAADPEPELDKVKAFLRPIQVLPFGQDEASQWALLDASHRRQGNRIEAEDGMIAATALAQHMTLVTGNTRHLGRVKGLKLVDWELHLPKRMTAP